jgi:hypothetical protein
MAWVAIALLVALMWAWYWPADRLRGATPGSFRYIVLRWFHSLVWVLLAISFLLRAIWGSAVTPITNITALSALLVYLVFMTTLLTRGG